MKHPFAYIQLSNEDINRVTGAVTSSNSGYEVSPSPSLFVSRPPVATTMAIGEEGGDFLNQDLF